MKIYFIGKDEEVAGLLSEYGEVLVREIESGIEPGYIYERNVEHLHEADVVVADVTTPSLGVGYEIGLAESENKRILCLYRQVEDRAVSAMILGNRNLALAEYESIDDIEGILRDFF